MQKEKKDTSKDKELKEQGLNTEAEQKKEALHNAIGVISRYLVEEKMLNKHLTYTNESNDGYRMNLTVHGFMEWMKGEDELWEEYRNRLEDEKNEMQA